MAASAPITERINNLHAMRVFAAILVIYYHTGYKLAGMGSFGGFSVPIFFIISGFLMAMIATERPRQFIQRRLLRIIPAYWIFTSIIFLISAGFPGLFHSSRPDVIWLLKSLLFIPFQKAPGNIEPLVFVGWTLNCEIILYFLIAICLRFSKRPAAYAAFAMLAFMLVCAYFAGHSSIAFFYSRSTMLSFILGLAIYPFWKLLTTTQAVRLRGLAYALLVIGTLTLCLLEGLAIDPYLTADGMFQMRSILPQLESLLLVLCALTLAKSGHDIKSDRLMIVAESTYVLYLVHAYVILAIIRLVKHLPACFAVDRPLGLFSAIVLSMLIALVVHLRVELPIMARLSKAFLPPTRLPDRMPARRITPALVKGSTRIPAVDLQPAKH